LSCSRWITPEPVGLSAAIAANTNTTVKKRKKVLDLMRPFNLLDYEMKALSGSKRILTVRPSI
jgi:hypothetical protein